MHVLYFCTSCKLEALISFVPDYFCKDVCISKIQCLSLEPRAPLFNAQYNKMSHTGTKRRNWAPKLVFQTLLPIIKHRGFLSSGFLFCNATDWMQVSSDS